MGIVGKQPDQNESQKRILLVTAIAFLFFIVYDMLVLQPNQRANISLEANKTNQQKSQAIKSDNLALTSSTLSSQNKTNNLLSESKIVSTIKTKNSIFEIDNLGRISQVTLLHKQYVDEKGKPIKLFTPNQLKPLEIRFANGALNEEAFKTDVNVNSAKLDATKSKKELIITQKLSTTTLTKKIVFYPDGHYDIAVSTSTQEQFFITPGYRPNVVVDQYVDHGVLLINNDNTLTVVEDGDMESNNEEFVGVQTVSSFDRYYATMLYNFNKNLTVSILNNNSNPEPFIHVLKEIKLNGYAGAKEYDLLNSLHPRLTGAIEYGWFTFIAKPMFAMMKVINDYIGNWGWTIVIVTILVKLILFPLSYKSMVSMNKLKKLAPKIKHIQEKYKDDKQKMSAHMMQLYQKEGANPMGGCLPILLQIPVFFAIYRVLLNAIELKGSPWIFWIHDLSAMDPYFVLPVLMGVSMYVQQKITPQQIQDETQKKIFQWLPVIFTVFFLWFPAGLTLYWFVSNLFTISQQYYVNKIFEKEEKGA